MNAAEQFRDAIRSAGINPPDEIEADGRLHRFSSNGKRGDDAGWYVLHDAGIPAGAFGCWRSGLNETWRVDLGRSLTRAEESQHRAKVEAMRREREAEEARRREEAKTQAAAIWKAAPPAPEDHPYLKRKGNKSHGLRLHDGALVVPMRDTAGELNSLQTIRPDGEKLNLPGGRVKGCYFSIGKPDGVLCIAEGFASGASVHEATGYAVAVAFSAGNIEAVAKALREKFPQVRIIIAGDNDENGTGQKKAEEAARAVGALVAIPADAGNDWNDIHRERGADSVRAAIENAQAVTAISEAANDFSVQLIRGSDVEPEPINWLWDGFLARGKLHLIAGAPGAGKTTIALALAATVTIGGRWPDGTRTEPGGVLIWSGEDDVADVLLPRLLVMGADRSRLYFVGDVLADGKKRPFDPSRDMAALERDAAGIGDVRLLIVDPVVNAVSGDSNKNAETRRSLQPVVDLASRLDAAALGISHFSKGTAGRDPVERVTGSVAFGALPRIIFAAAKTTDENASCKRMLVRSKSNIGPDGGGFGYDLEQVELQDYPGLTASRVLWGKSLEGTARDLLATVEVIEDERTERDEAAQWLENELEDGPVTAKQLQASAKAAGLAWRTVQRAKNTLGVKSHREGFGPDAAYIWQLPNTMRATKPHACHLSESGTHGTHGTHGTLPEPEPTPVGGQNGEVEV